jgi:adenylate cyclase
MTLRRALTRIGPFWYIAAAPLVVLVAAYLAQRSGWIDTLEETTVDVRFQQRAPFDPPADPRIIFVAIDQDSLKKIGRWPWSRAVQGDFCSLLSTTANPAATAFDLLYTDADHNNPTDDAHLGEGMGHLGTAISGILTVPPDPDKPATGPPQERWGLTRPLTDIEGDVMQIAGGDAADFPIPPVRNSSYSAFVDSAPTSRSGIRQKIPLVARVGHDVFPSLSLQALCLYWKVPPENVRVRLGQDIELPTPEGTKSIPIDKRGWLLLNYRNQARYLSLSYANLFGKLLENFQNNTPLPKEWPSLEGKIVIVGEDADGLSDMGPNPLSGSAPLVLVHITALNNILRGDYVRPVPFGAEAPFWLLLSWLTLLYVREKSIVFSVLVPATCIGLYLVAAQLCFDRWNLLFQVAWPILGFVVVHSGSTLLRWLKEQESRQQIRSVFSSYIAPAVMERLLEHPENVRLGGVSQPVTMLFSDIRGFTSLSETMTDVELVTQLNEYFERMVDCVNRYRGTLHKYIGDAVMAAWGDVAPEGPAIDAANAARSALAMRAELVLLNQAWTAQGRKPFKIGIGLNHGTVTVGNIGAPQRREFTLIGDPVNTAARLEGVTKEYKTDIAVGETVEALIRGEFLMRTLGLIVVQGKSRGLRVFELLDDLKNPAASWPQDWVARYEEAMEKYLAGEFTAAQSGFEACLGQRPGDYLCGHYRGLCRELIEHPPENWDGLHVMKTK